ncbi:uncharacterized protein LOC132784516 isoform X2 [Drosophila nasuta]|uniref:Uncharacterized protein LOC117574589 isoform X3 n=1 Tax=Drosophila albomicans TaxID=7291 RepID=A0A6P8XMZ0_DROAB|nr:uncharacterized protein LOC117574589 isoform X3 [Drosophila albomicans]XP_060646162.1 uncharacterized protein LOC132784516 isoform X2 [Drosophila nasuta]
MKSPSVATQTEKSALRTHGTKKTNVLQRPEPAKVSVVENQTVVIKSCEFEVFGIVKDVSFRHAPLVDVYR